MSRLMILPLAALPLLAACADPDLPLRIGPAGSSGRLSPDASRLEVRLDGSDCTARPRAVARDAAQGLLWQDALRCRDGRAGTVTLRPLPAGGYEAVVELGKKRTRLEYRAEATP